MSTAYDEIKTRLQGSMVALITPMHPDGKVDYKRLADLIDCFIFIGYGDCWIKFNGHQYPK